MSKHTSAGRTKSFLWGAAHVLDMGGVLLTETDWRGFEADAEALQGDWKVAINAANEHLDARKANEER